MATERVGNYTVTGPELRTKPKARWRLVCSRCGSTRVQTVAHVVWDEELQRWEFDDYYGDGDLDWCVQCECEVVIEEIRLP